MDQALSSGKSVPFSGGGLLGRIEEKPPRSISVKSRQNSRRGIFGGIEEKPDSSEESLHESATNSL